MKTVLLVNPLSSAKYLSEALGVHNIKTIAVFTNVENLEDYIRPNAEMFDEQFHFDSFNAEDIYPKIEHLSVDYVVNGGDQTVELTDMLAAKFACKYKNSVTTSLLRQNKFLQQQTISDAGLPSIRQVKMPLNNLDYQVLMKLSYPIFAKPANGAASIGAFKALSYEQLIDLLAKQPKSVFLKAVDEYIFQEYIEGEELFVDTFSINADHLISGVYRYRKEIKNNSSVYRYIEVVREPEVIEQAVKFTQVCLDNVSLDNGFAHTEIFSTNGDYRLIEINPRISGCGGQINVIGHLAGLTTQEEFLIKCIFGNHEYGSLSRLKPKRFARLVLLYANQVIDKTILKSFHSALTLSSVPIDITAGISLADVRQFVILVSDNFDQLNHDTEHLIRHDVV